MSLIKHTNRFVPWNDIDVLANRMNRLFGGHVGYANEEQLLELIERSR